MPLEPTVSALYITDSKDLPMVRMDAVIAVTDRGPHWRPLLQQNRLLLKR